MLSDLSPGDRMSLKGKLFELQKKLSILDLEDKLDPTNLYSFKPKLNHFDLPDRSSFLDQSNKAELIRQQKKKMLVESLANESEETCTFTPTIYTSSQSQRKWSQRRHDKIPEDRPVYERLNEEGKKYAKEQQKRKQQAKHFDFEGNKMFTPHINKHSTTLTQHRFHNNTDSTDIAHTSMYITPPPNTISAEEFLYQDAKDRELRLKQLVLKHEEDARKTANRQKVNLSSEKLLQQKLERHTRHVFSLFDKDNDDVVQYEDVTKFMERQQLALFDQHTEHMIKAKELLWMVIDHHKQGMVHRISFQDICMSFLLHKNPSSFIPSIQRCELRRQQDNAATSSVPTIPSYSTLQTMKERELLEFKSIIHKLIAFAEQKKHSERQRRHPPAASPGSSRGQPPPPPPLPTTADSPLRYEHDSDDHESMDKHEYKPKLTPQSMKLAERKKQKELALLATMRSPPSEHKRGSEGLDGQSIDGDVPPEDEERSHATVPSVSSLSHYELMHARAALTQQKKDALKTKLYQQEAHHYTFHPKLVAHHPLHANNDPTSPMQAPPHNHDEAAGQQQQQQAEAEADSDDHNSSSHNTNQSPPSHPQQYIQQNVHQRLYQLGDKKSLNKKSHAPTEDHLHHPPPPSYLQELQSCTFHPKIGPAPPSSFKQAHLQNIHGTDKDIQRIKQAHDVKMKAKEDEENEWKKQDASYRKNRAVLMKQGAKAPELKTEERMKLQRTHHDETSKLSPVKTDLIVNVKILANKTARIRIAKGDDPLDLAQRFAKIYSLDAAAAQMLYTVLYQSMVQNQLIAVPAVEEEAEVAPPPPPPAEESRSRSHRHHHRHQPVRRVKRRSFINMSAMMGGSTKSFDPLDIHGGGEFGTQSEEEEDKLSGSDEEDDDDESYSSYTSSLGSDDDADDDDEEEEEDYDEAHVHEYVEGEESEEVLSEEDDEEESEEEFNIHDPQDSSESGSIDPTPAAILASNKVLQQLDASSRKGKKKRSILVDLL